MDILVIHYSYTPLHLHIFSFPLSYNPLKKYSPPQLQSSWSRPPRPSRPADHKTRPEDPQIPTVFSSRVFITSLCFKLWQLLHSSSTNPLRPPPVLASPSPVLHQSSPVLQADSGSTSDRRHLLLPPGHGHGNEEDTLQRLSTLIPSESKNSD